MSYSHGLIDGFRLDNDPLFDAQPSAGEVVRNEDEIERFTIKEDISAIERTLLFLNGGHRVQQLRAIENLPQLVATIKRTELDTIVSALVKHFPTFDEELQGALGSTLLAVLEENTHPLEAVHSWSRPLVMEALSEKNQYNLCDSWYEFMREIQSVSSGRDLEEILGIALGRGKAERALEDRLCCSRLLGTFANVTTCKGQMISELITQAIAISQDTDYQVRSSACEELPRMFKLLNNETRSHELLPELFELLTDEKTAVKVNALKAMIDSMSVLDANIVKEEVMPILKTFMQPRELELELQICLSKLFGFLMEQVDRCVDEEYDGNVFLPCYRFLAMRKNHDLRFHCARNLPAMLILCGHLKYLAYFHDILIQLATDENEDVRFTIAAQFLEVCKIIGREVAGQYLVSPLIRLLKDDKDEVQLRILQDLSDIVHNMEFIDNHETAKAMEPIVQDLASKAKTIGPNWRLQQCIMVSLSNLSKFTNGDVVYSSLIPIALDFLSQGVASVRTVAAKSLALFLRAEMTEKQRTSVYLKLLREFWNGKSYWLRLSFIDVASHSLQVFSARFLKVYFLDFCIDVLYDSVPNVRWHALDLLPRLKQTIKLPHDVDKLERLNSTMSNLMIDRDVDVCEKARAVHSAFKQTSVRMEAGAGMLDMNGTAGGVSKFDEEDQRKEAEEVKILISIEEAVALRAEKNSDSISLRLRNTRMSDPAPCFSINTPGSEPKNRKPEKTPFKSPKAKKGKDRPGPSGATQLLTGSLFASTQNRNSHDGNFMNSSFPARSIGKRIQTSKTETPSSPLQKARHKKKT